MIIIDTNVLSELMRPEPAQTVVAWLQDSGDAPLATTAVTVGEIIFGLERLASGRRRDDLQDRFARFVSSEDGLPVLAYDEAAARVFGEIAAHRERAGLAIHGNDLMIAATALRHGASVATRNTGDFAATGVELLNPWAP